MFAFFTTAAMARCATVAHGRFQRVPVDSTPSGAAVSVDCGDAPREAGYTPTVVALRRGAVSCAISLSKPGYDDQIVTLRRKWSNGAWSNLAPGLVIEAAGDLAAAQGSLLRDNPYAPRIPPLAGRGLLLGTGVGLLIDYATGAMYRQDPARIEVTLRRKLLP